MPDDVRIPIQAGDSRPACASCGESLQEVIDHRSPSPRTDFQQVLHLLTCPHCHKVLGASLNSELIQVD